MRLEGERAEQRGGSHAHVEEVAKRFHVHYDVHPESVASRDHSMRQVGFRLELHAGVGTEPGARLGDDQCREALLGLLELSSLLVPAAVDDCCYEVSGSPTAFYNLGSPQGGQGCVRLDIRVLGRERWDRPVTGMDARALRAMEDRLRALGVPSGSAYQIAEME